MSTNNSWRYAFLVFIWYALWIFLDKVLHAGTPTLSHTPDCFLVMYKYLLKENVWFQVWSIKQPLPPKKDYVQHNDASWTFR